jgi:hypothetical protein
MEYVAVFLFVLFLVCGFTPFAVATGEKPKDVKTREGIYPFYCSRKLLFFESHREKGMEGTLEVVEQH